jgi:hypothetical protein
MAQFRSSPENEAKRLRAYELYLSAGEDGKRRSLRSISQELGVALSAVQYWRDQDGWERRLRETMLTAGRSAEMSTNQVKMALRKGLLEGVQQMYDIIQDKDGKAKDKILAFRELVSTSVRLRAIDFGGGDGPQEPWVDTPPVLPESESETTLEDVHV